MHDENVRKFSVGLLLLLMSACGGGGGGSGMSTSSSPPTTTSNTSNLSVMLTPGEIYPTPTSGGLGTATLTVDLTTGVSSGKVLLAAVTATGVTLNEGLAGTSGDVVIMLTQNAAVSGEWDLPASSVLTADQLTALDHGKLYLTVQSAKYPAGEIRGQIIPGNISVGYAILSGAQEVPAVTSAALGVALATVDSNANTVSVVAGTPIADVTGVELDTGASGATGMKLLGLTQSSTDMAIWTATSSAIAADEVMNYDKGMWYVNVLSAVDPLGELRGQLAPLPTSVTAPTLTELQTNVFTPLCSGCHDGVGTVPPGALNLTAGGTYKALVDVATAEQPNLKFVVPGDPTDSYVMQKLLGVPSISGGRMPLNGPYLDATTLAQIQAWIAAGAANN